VTVDGVQLRRNSRVRLRPGRSADVFDLALAGRIGVVEEIVTAKQREKQRDGKGTESTGMKKTEATPKE